MSFSYKNNLLHVEEIDIKTIAQKIGTPFYCYSANSVLSNFHSVKDAFAPLSPRLAADSRRLLLAETVAISAMEKMPFMSISMNIIKISILG